MKSPLVPLLLLSLAGNATLAFFVLRPALPPVPAITPAGAVTSAATAPAAGAVTVSPPAAPVNWQTLKPDRNLHTLVANLRATGFPPAMIRALASQLVSEQLDSSAADHLPFWKQNFNNPEFVTAQQQLSTQRREMLTDLLGPDISAACTQRNRMGGTIQTIRPGPGGG